MLFEIHAQHPENGNKKIFFYDNMKNILTNEDGYVYEYLDKPTGKRELRETKAFDKDHPIKKSKQINTLKIQMGLSCNYSCDYCSQKFVERPPETSKKDIDAFLKKLDVLEFNEEQGLKVEFWGGEPFVYWKTMKPLAEALRDRFKDWKKKPRFSVITNGSLLTDDIIDWLMMMEFSVSISHDGPGQHVRGPDPFDDPEQRERLVGFYRMMTRLGKGISFNPMLSAKNQSRKDIQNWFINVTGDENIQLGEGTLVDAYDADGSQNSLNTLEEHFQFRQRAFGEFYAEQGRIGFGLPVFKVDQFTDDLLSHNDAKYIGQKCGSDEEGMLAVDMRGNVITCQNVSATETAMNGESHLCGNLDDYDNVKVKSSTHWMNRENCSKCPVLSLCKGSCMFLQGDLWDISCENSYSDNVVYFALSMVAITGYIPTLIRGEGLPPERQDVFGTVLEHKEKPKKKTFPIKVVSEKFTNNDGCEVYTKSYVENK